MLQEEYKQCNIHSSKYNILCDLDSNIAQTNYFCTQRISIYKEDCRLNNPFLFFGTPYVNLSIISQSQKSCSKYTDHTPPDSDVVA